MTTKCKLQIMQTADQSLRDAYAALRLLTAVHKDDCKCLRCKSRREVCDAWANNNYLLRQLKETRIPVGEYVSG